MNPSDAATNEPSWPEVISGLLAGDDLTPSQCTWAMNEVMSGAASPARISGFLIALQGKGVQGAELAPLVAAMLEHAVPVTVEGRTVDTCGTGGDHSGSVNISTMAAVAVAATGRRVVKHGNRAASSKSGSADVLEALGIVVDLSPELIATCVDRVGIAFCFAPVFHPSMRYAGPVRKELGVPTVFNILGPLANPAKPSAQVVGVADARVAPQVADALHRRGTSALVVRGEDGLDELTTLGASRIWDCRGDSIVQTVLTPEQVGLPLGEPGALDGGDANFNARIARLALSATPGVEVQRVREAVALNAAAAICALDHTSGEQPKPLVEALRDAVVEVMSVLDQGKGSETLASWAKVTRSLQDSRKSE